MSALRVIDLYDLRDKGIYVGTSALDNINQICERRLVLRDGFGRRNYCSGWLVDFNSKKKIWFLLGEHVSCEQFFESLRDDLKEKAIWELDEWK